MFFLFYFNRPSALPLKGSEPTVVAGSVSEQEGIRDTVKGAKDKIKNKVNGTISSGVEKAKNKIKDKVKIKAEEKIAKKLDPTGGHLKS